MARKIVAELMSHQSSSLVKEKQLLIAAIVGCENPPPPHSFLIILGQKDALMPNCWHIWVRNGLFFMGAVAHAHCVLLKHYYSVDFP